LALVSSSGAPTSFSTASATLCAGTRSPTVPAPSRRAAISVSGPGQKRRASFCSPNGVRSPIRAASSRDCAAHVNGLPSSRPFAPRSAASAEGSAARP
jgi:hypothetical protein